MINEFVDIARDALSSPWAYVALFAIAAIDAFFPAVPSESLVVTAGVFSAADGQPELLAIIAAAATGAFVGDHISYLIGHVVPLEKLQGRRRAAFEWARTQLLRRGGSVLIIARYVPGGRTAVTLTLGATRYPWRTFAGFDAIAALSWGTFSAMIGYIGGEAFEDDPFKGLLLGFALTAIVAGTVELVRHVRGRRRSSSA